MDVLIDPWDVIEVLENHVHDPGFSEKWRAFVRACSLAMPALPGKARGWIAAADKYEQGRVTADELTAVRVRAWKYRDARKVTASKGEMSRLRMAMHRLWPGHDADHWADFAWLFLQDCETAGVPESNWWPLLRSSFPDILGHFGRSRD